MKSLYTEKSESEIKFFHIRKVKKPTAAFITDMTKLSVSISSSICWYILIRNTTARSTFQMTNWKGKYHLCCYIGISVDILIVKRVISYI